MNQLTSVELENLRHLMMESQVVAQKSRFFAQHVSNPQLEAHLNRKAQNCEQNVQRLNQFLSQ